jgi:hypothetical protein
MKFKNWIESLVKPRFYLRRQLYFMAGSCGQKVSAHLLSSESYMPLAPARRAAMCFCLGLFLAIPAVTFAQTNYYAASGTEYNIIGSLPGDQVYPDVALNAKGGYVVWQDNITDPVGEGISAMQLNSTLSGSGDVFSVNVSSTNNQQNAHVALLKNGGAAFVWQGGPNNIQHIYARFLNASNLWLNSTNVCVSTFAASLQDSPAIATLTNGNVIVVWDSYDQATPSSQMDVYGQILSTNGTMIGTNFLINVFTNFNQRNPAVASLNNGGFVVAWVSEQERAVGVTNSSDSSASSMSLSSVDVYERLFTLSGSNAVPSTGEILVNADNNPCARPAIATAVDGSYMVTWCAEDMANLTNGWDIYERSFTNSSGGAVSLVNSYVYGDQYAPRISAINGDYLIVWTSLGQDGSREGVYGQFIHEGDSPVGSEFRVNTTTLGQQMQPAVASDGAEQFLAVWTGFTFGPNGFDLYAQRYVNVQAVLQPMAAPFVWVPFVVSNNIYQPELVVSWPAVQGLSVSNYEVFVDGGTTPTALVTSNQWIMTAANGLTTNSTHSFTLEYMTSGGFLSPISPSASGTTWSGLNWGGIPYEWMAEFFGGYYGGTYHTNFWPLANSPVASGGPTLLQIFMTGGNPFDPTTWLHPALTMTSKGIFLNWNTQPGMTYQVQMTTNMKAWNNFGTPRFESGTNDSIFVGGTGTSYYRVQLLWQ